MIIKVKTLVFCENFMSTETFAYCETNTNKESVFGNKTLTSVLL